MSLLAEIRKKMRSHLSLLLEGMILFINDYGDEVGLSQCKFCEKCEIS